MRVLADAELVAVEAHQQDALGGADVEDDAPARPVRGDLELALVDAGRVDARGSRAAGPRTASGRWCSAACPRCRPSSRRSGRPPQPSPGRARVGRPEELEAPATVEREPLPVVDAVHGESADPRQFGVVPGSCHKNDCPTLRQTGQHDDARSRDAPRDRSRPPLRGAVGDPRGRSRGEARRGPRAARTQWRGQDDDGPGADRADRPDRGTGLGRRPRRDRTSRGGPLAGRDPDRDARAVREAVGDGEPRFLRAAVWPRCDDPGRASRVLPPPLLAVGPARRRRRQLQQGHEAEAGDRPRPAPRAGGRLPRRADGGARPGGGVRRARGDREPAAVGPDHRARDAQPRRGRPAVRPGRVRARGAVARRFAGGVA